MTQTHMQDYLRDSEIKRSSRIKCLREDVRKTVNYRNNIMEGSSTDKLRKEVVLKIITHLLNQYSPKMGTVPCKEHLFERSRKIESLLFRNTDIDTYTSYNVFEQIAKSVSSENKIRTKILS